MVPPFDHEWIVAGQGTVGLEILDQLPQVGTVLVPIGGGGLISGVAAAIKLTKPSVQIVGVEHGRCLHEGVSSTPAHVVTLERTHSIADGLHGRPARQSELSRTFNASWIDIVTG